MISKLHSRDSGIVQHRQTINVIDHINYLKVKNQIIISLDAEKSFENPKLLHNKYPREIRKIWEVPKYKKAIQQAKKEHQSTWRSTKSNPIKIRNKTGCSLSLCVYLFNLVLDIFLNQ